jgi:hypothetical protein
MRQLIATLLQAILPQPTLDRLRAVRQTLRRHLHEPQRRRPYQTMPQLC